MFAPLVLVGFVPGVCLCVWLGCRGVGGVVVKLGVLCWVLRCCSGWVLVVFLCVLACVVVGLRLGVLFVQCSFACWVGVFR